MTAAAAAAIPTPVDSFDAALPGIAALWLPLGDDDDPSVVDAPPLAHTFAPVLLLVATADPLPADAGGEALWL